MSDTEITKRPAYLNVLDEKTVAECRRAMTLIREVKASFSKPSDTAKLFKASQELMAIQAWLIAELMVAEQEYRIKLESYRRADWNKKQSVTTAETAAKAEPEYAAYKFLQYVYDLCTEQVNLLKKYATLTGDEYKNY